MSMRRSLRHKMTSASGVRPPRSGGRTSAGAMSRGRHAGASSGTSAPRAIPDSLSRQFERAAMQLGHRLHQAQAKAHAGRAAAGIAAIEALHHLGFFRVGDARAIVRNGNLRAPSSRACAPPPRSHRSAAHTSAHCRSGCSAPGRAAPDRRRPQRTVGRNQVDILQFRRGRVEFHRIGRKIGDVERHEAGAAHAGIDFRSRSRASNMRITRSTSATAPSISA